ncbi:hypothetical protein [Treponema endosymbiont of Eucomonympha sp.]|uniref:hypothetical protein n=1 Tax=Treponema endosymbiont of Eucomonympha sp. TaxID=1580831 RepID=UPI000A604B6B|nr:hypothetical protein [Treponema endosymbiont of Eucomonympha sp.]
MSSNPLARALNSLHMGNDIVDDVSFSIFVTIFVVTISAVLFVLGREFFCWYFKINERIELLRRLEQKIGINSTDKGDKT